VLLLFWSLRLLADVLPTQVLRAKLGSPQYKVDQRVN
jgi:hypothetical protein